MSEKPKIFGLGLSKTGTSSLNEALNLVGFRSVHYPHDQRTYDELRAGCWRLSLLETHDAITDLPAAPFYAQFDRAFPGSKFILTVRDKDSWLRSCEMHWRLLREWLGNFPQFAKVHDFISACVYGTTAFERERFASVYDAHLGHVCDYFAGKPDRFLLLDICGGEGWEKLCPFLGVAAPACEFPRANEWMHRLAEAAADVVSVVPEGATMILADGEGFGSDFAAGRRQLPFLEQGGVYWGAPPDSGTAIRELERMRKGGAQFFVFGWPAFWQFDYYPAFLAHLGRYRCILSNDRVRVFALRVRSRRPLSAAHPREGGGLGC